MLAVSGLKPCAPPNTPNHTIGDTFKEARAMAQCWGGFECWSGRGRMGPDVCGGCGMVYQLVRRDYLCPRCLDDKAITKRKLPCTGRKCHEARIDCDRQRMLQGIRRTEQGEWVRQRSLKEMIDAVGNEAYTTQSHHPPE